jgi:uncharacterized membrane protein YhaH (DUF805 family)
VTFIVPAFLSLYFFSQFVSLFVPILSQEDKDKKKLCILLHFILCCTIRTNKEKNDYNSQDHKVRSVICENSLLNEQRYNRATKKTDF